ncbi:MAG: PAS domain S-box protein [bacterium]
MFKHILAGLVVLATGLASVPGASAAAEVRVGLYENRPLVFTDADGEAAGIYPDLLAKVAAREGWRLRWVRGSWQQCLKRLERGELDLMPSIAYSEERAARFDFNDEPVLTNWGQVHVREDSGIESVLDLRGRTVAVLAGDLYYDAFEALVRRFGVQCRFLEVSSYASVLRAVTEGRADAGVMNRLYAAQHGQAPSMRCTAIVFSPVELRFAAPQGRGAALLEALDTRLAGLKDSENSAYYRSMDRWLGGPPAREWPPWATWVLVAAAALVGVLAAGSAALSVAVRRRTAELRERNRALQAEVAERHRAEQALRQAEQERAIVLDTVSEVVTYLDRDLRITWANRAGAELSGLRPEEIAERHCYTVWQGRDEPCEPCIPRQAMETGTVQEGDVTTPDGRIYHLRAYPVRDEAGAVVGAVEVGLDITERRRAEEEARRQSAFRDTLIEASPAFFVAIGPDRKTLMMNESMLLALGYSLDEVVGADYLTTFVPQREHERVTRVFRRLTDIQGPALNENHVVAKDGRELLVEWHGRPVLDEKGELDYFFGVGIDITQRRRAERELAEREALYRGIVEDATDLICRYRQDCTLTFVNRAYSRYFDRRPEELVGASFLTLLPEGDREAVRRRIAALSRDHRVFSHEHRVVGPDGGIRWHHWTNRAVVDDEGRVVEVQAVGRDVTPLREQRQRLEELVSERTAELEEVNRELEAFAYSVSHDLRAPLRAIEGFSDALLDDYGDRLDEQGRDVAASIARSARKMQALIDDLLAYSRLGRTEMCLQPVSLQHVAEESYIQLGATIGDAGAEVRIDGPLPAVVGHKATLVQAVTNLLSNAVKFVAPGETPRVRVRAERRDGAIRLWVEDQGIGIAPEDRERIFTVFERLHGDQAYGGTGVGLAIVRRGIERMGGRVGVDSEPGAGSRFWIELPAADAEPEA